MSMFYGPVLSRRFGHSLGIDIIPYKICSYDCIYCQLGKTTRKTIERKSYTRIDLKEFTRNLGSIINSKKKIDYLTFSGSGEPTLNSDIGRLIQEVKTITDIPVVVLTNGSLLYRKDVINDIKKADLIKVSLDAPDQKSFKKINCPHNKIQFALLPQGFDLLLRNFSGKIWVEIMLVKGINDSIETAYKFRDILNKLGYTKNESIIEKIHLNTPVRPPGSKNVLVPDTERLLKIKDVIGNKAELIKKLDIKITVKKDKSLDDNIIELVRRRPVTVKDISRSLQVNINQVVKSIQRLLDKKEIKSREHDNEKFYYK